MSIEDEIDKALNEAVNDKKTNKPKEREFIHRINVNDEGIKKKANVYQTGNDSFEADVLHPNKPEVDWIKEFKEKYEDIIDETELKDGKNLTVRYYHRIHPKTGERLTTQYINSYAAITWTTSKLDQMIADEQRFHHPNNPTTTIDNNQLLNIFKQSYALDIAEMLINNSLITVKEFAEKVNISEQMARIHLNKFVKLGFLTTLIYSKGSPKHYKSILKEEKLRKILNIFLE